MTAAPSSFAPFDPEPIRQVLTLLGKDPALTRLRFFAHKLNPRKKEIGARKGAGIDAAFIEAQHRQERGAYFVVNIGGDTAASITSCVALFVEWDDMPIEWQRTAWRTLNLPEPSLQIETGGASIHSYWILQQPIGPDEWVLLQNRLIKHCDSDAVIKDASRVMRLPGAWYIGPDGQPVAQSRLTHASDRRYSVQEVMENVGAGGEQPATQPDRHHKAEATPRNYPPRTIQEVMDALRCYPVIAPKTSQRETFMALAWGLREAVREAGGTDELALQLIEAHSPGVVDAAEYLKTEPHTIGSSKFFSDAYKLHGWRTRDELAPRRATRSQTSKDDDGEHLGEEPQALPLAKPKRHTLAPDEVMVQLPARLGHPRLNIRTNEFHCGSKTYTADDVGRLYLHLSGEAERWPKDTTADALVELAKHHAFDPVEEELNHIGGTVEPLPMKQWERLDKHLLGIDDPIAAAFLPQFLISAVARVFRPGCTVRRSPVLIGAQWRGKTTLGRILFGEAHWIENVTDLDKDDLMRLQSAWGVELAELNGITRRKDQESLKTFLTATRDVFRVPYGKSVTDYHRRCVFWGTSNGPPLRDLSGSSRFVCIPLPDRMLPLDWAKEHRAALWSRAVEQFRQIEPGQEPWDRVSEEDRAAVEERNSNYQETDPWAEEVAKHLREATDRPVSAAYLLDRMDIPKSQRNNAMAARVRQLAEVIGWVMERRSVAGERRMGFWPPEPTSQPPAEEAAAIALPHLPPPCHSGATPADANQGNGSAPASIPAIPISPKLEKEEEGSTAPAPTPAAAAARGEVFGSFGVAGSAAPPNASHGAASEPVSAMAGGMAGGVAAVWQEPPSPELLPWLAQISHLRSKHPADPPATLALKLFAKHGLRTTGRAIRDLETWIKAQPVEEF